MIGSIHSSTQPSSFPSAGRNQADTTLDSLDLKSTAAPSDDATREAFQDFVGQTLFGQMLQSMRSTVGKPAYFHGGRGEEVFQKQLDQLLVENISDASASKLSDPMYDLFRLQRSQ